jgi:hypothetical protein
MLEAYSERNCYFMGFVQTVWENLKSAELIERSVASIAD